MPTILCSRRWTSCFTHSMEMLMVPLDLHGTRFQSWRWLRQTSNLCILMVKHTNNQQITFKGCHRKRNRNLIQIITLNLLNPSNANLVKIKIIHGHIAL